MGNTVRRSWRRSKVLVAGVLALAASVSIACYWRVGDRTTLPGALPFDPERNPGMTEAHLRGRDFTWAKGPPGRWDGFLTCHPGDCGAAPRVRFLITAEKDARTTPMVDALSGPRPEKGGYIVAQLINLDSTYGYRPFGMTARDTAYLWVGPTKNGSKRFAIYRLRSGEAPKLLAKAGKANYCPQGTRDVTDIHVPPELCNERRRLYGTDSATTGRASGFGSPSHLRLAAATTGAPLSVTSMSHADGLWVSCSGGCCEAGDWAFF